MARKISTVTLTGVEDVDRKFREYPKLAKKWMRKATRAGAKEVLQDAKKRVPVKSGTLRRSLKVRAVKRSRKKQGHAIGSGQGASLARGEAFYAHMVEFGTKRAPPKPFLRPALYENREKVKKVAIENLRGSIKELARS